MKAANHACSVFLRAIILRMKELGLNQSALAKRMGVTRAYALKLLAHDVNFTFVNAMRLAKALEMDFVPGLVAGNDMKDQR